MTSRFEARVAGRLPQALTELIASRFGQVTTHRLPDSTVLNGNVADQAAVRALLGLIWDSGSSVLSFSVEPDTAFPST
jgi:hypothetical protein